MNMAIPTLGVNKMIRGLSWDRATHFRQTQTRLLRFGGRIGEGLREVLFCIPVTTSATCVHFMSNVNLVHVVAGTYCERAALRYLTLRSAGHFVSISQPRLALRILQIFCSEAIQTCY